MMSDFPKPQRVKLNSFGETIRRVEAERKAEAEAAVAAGWTEADHPDKCCPHLVSTPQPKRADRSVEEIERLRDKAANRAKWWADAVTRKQAALDARDAARPRFDHGMLNLPVGPRAREANAGDRMWRELEVAKERAKHFDRLTVKYAAQLQARP